MLRLVRPDWPAESQCCASGMFIPDSIFSIRDPVLTRSWIRIKEFKYFNPNVNGLKLISYFVLPKPIDFFMKVSPYFCEAMLKVQISVCVFLIHLVY
jgi:hypothetical protein